MAQSEAFVIETKARPWWLFLLEGIAAIIIGFLLVSSTAKTLVVLVQFVGIYWLVKGIFDLVAMFIDHSAWGWKLFSGIIGIIAGILVLNHPLWSAVLLPATMVWILGFYGIFAGILMIVQAFRGAGWGVGILGVLAIFLGIFILGNTFITTVTAVWLAGFFFIIGGIVAVVQAFRQRN